MRIAITGLGACASVGGDVRSICDAVREGRTGIAALSRFDASGYAAAVAGEIRGGEGCVAYAIAAAREALGHARIAAVTGARAAGARVALILGTSAGPARLRFERGDHTRHDALAEAVARAAELAGPRITVSTACASSNVALGVGRELIRGGYADVVLAGGSDALMEIRFAGFDALGAISAQPCAPFSTPEGMSLGEGAAFLVLESVAHARARGAEVLAELSGYGSSADGWHATAPDPRGVGMARALSAALVDARVAAIDVGLYNAHGTGTASNDAAEWQAMLRVFGERARALPVTAPKSVFGHTFGAAGALEAVLSVWAIREHVVPATPTFAALRFDEGPSGIAAHIRDAAIAHVLSNNAAFGGANAAVVISRAQIELEDRKSGKLEGSDQDPDVRCTVPLRRHVFVAGFAVAQANDAVLAKLPVRGLDPIARAMIAAIAVAAREGGVELGRRTFDRIGCWAGVVERPATSTKLYEDGFYERGGLAVSPEAFSRTVMSAPAGAASRVLGLRGPTATLSSGPGSGLLAIALAAIMLSQRDDADTIFAGDASDDGATFAMLTQTAPSERAIAIEAIELAAPTEPSAPSLEVAVRLLKSGETKRVRAREGTCALHLSA